MLTSPRAWKGVGSEESEGSVGCVVVGGGGGGVGVGDEDLVCCDDLELLGEHCGGVGECRCGVDVCIKKFSCGLTCNPKIQGWQITE